jgi:hypothetical protein
MRLLIWGGAGPFDYAAVKAVLDNWHARTPITLLIEDGGDGLGELVRRWGWLRDVELIAVGSGWRAQLQLDPDRILAFPGADAYAQEVARREMIRIIEVGQAMLAV